MMLSSTIVFPCGKSEANRLLKSISPELDSHKSDRSETKVAYEKEAVRISLKASDIGALRASFNSITKLLSVHIEMQRVK